MEQTASSEVTEEVQELKSKGNTAYGAGNYAEAIQYFTQAIHLDGTNGTLFCNRSMAHSSLLQWEDALSDAKMAVRLSPKYEKAYFRLVKALVSFPPLPAALLTSTVRFNWIV
jgi:stress-induced-phosphoprotein 1